MRYNLNNLSSWRPGMVDKEPLCGCATFFLFSKEGLISNSLTFRTSQQIRVYAAFSADTPQKRQHWS